LEPVAPTVQVLKPAYPRVPGAEPPEYPTIPATRLPTKPILEEQAAWSIEPHPARTLTSRGQIDQWLQVERFSKLTVELKDGVAVIRGQVKRHADAWELAELLQELPDLERIVVGQISRR
jgi:hypothetical protein